MAQEAARVGEIGLFAEEGELAGLVQRDQPGQEQPAEESAQHPHRQEEGGTRRYPPPPIGRDAAARHDHVDMRMMRHRRAPGVKHGGDADAGAQMLWVRRDGHHRLGGGAEQQIVDDRLVLPGDVGDLGRQREDDVEIANRQQVGLALGQPVSRGGALALRAVPVAAGVIGDPDVAAVVAASTWPPSAAVRQFSIADMTFSWPRLRWPAWATR